MQEPDPRDKLAFPTAAVLCSTAVATPTGLSRFYTGKGGKGIQAGVADVWHDVPKTARRCARYAQVPKVHGEALSPSKLAPRSPQEISKYSRSNSGHRTGFDTE